MDPWQEGHNGVDISPIDRSQSWNCRIVSALNYESPKVYGCDDGTCKAQTMDGKAGTRKSSRRMPTTDFA
ncbi:hypothetical protein TELCIR_08870 [Teladorsagia circumcincta]|uniref:Uncharacterized protein n=1 Tax=Teladorsagia circumcincta TaxID=45464 RepID=A0A2G9UGD3_TELCI|nr:hypothetical protein TELCIR_08870 [Teladorsagia circumcincta]